MTPDHNDLDYNLREVVGILFTEALEDLEVCVGFFYIRLTICT